jgi:hypothetical protein
VIRRPRSLLALVAALAALSCGHRVCAQGAPLPEPLFNETITDVEGDEVGEFELEINLLGMRALHRGGYELQTSAEIELLVLPRLGLLIEPGVSRGVERAGAGADYLFGVNAGASWKLIQDVQHAFHLQAELTARLPFDVSRASEPGESALPLSADLRSALRRGAWTLRGSVGVEAGGRAAHVPMRGSLGLYLPLGDDRNGFWGVEADADGGRERPFLVALNLVPSLVSLGLPFKIGIAVPWAIGVRSGEPALGLLLRLFIESERELHYEQTGPRT